MKTLLVLLMLAPAMSGARPIYTKRSHIKRLEIATKQIEKDLGPVTIDYRSVDFHKRSHYYNYTGVLYCQDSLQGQFVFVIGRNGVVYENRIFNKRPSDGTVVYPYVRNRARDIFLGMTGSLLLTGAVVWILSTITIVVQ